MLPVRGSTHITFIYISYLSKNQCLTWVLMENRAPRRGDPGQVRGAGRGCSRGPWAVVRHRGTSVRAVATLVTPAAKPPGFHLESVLVAADSAVVTALVKELGNTPIPSQPSPYPYEGVIPSRENLSF